MYKHLFNLAVLALIVAGGLVLTTLAPSTGAQMRGLHKLDFNGDYGTLTLQADGTSLVAILKQLKEKNGIEVVVPDLTDQVVTTNLTNTPLQDALRQILPRGSRFHVILREGELRVPANTGDKKPGHVEPKPRNAPTKDKTSPLADALRTRVKVDPAKVTTIQTAGERGTKEKPNQSAVDGSGPKRALPPKPETDRYARLNLSITRSGKVEVIRFLEVPGKLILPTRIVGELVYVATVGSQVVAIGSVQDPLGIRSYLKDDIGHSAGQQDIGTFVISLPERFLDRGVLSRTTVSFYYLDETASRTIPLTPENFYKLREYLKPASEIRGKALVDAFARRYEGRPGR